MRNRGIIIAAFAALFGSGQAQMPTLGEATAVDVRVNTVQWQPHGRGLIYSREEGEGTGLAVYAVGKLEGKVLIHLEKGDTWRAQWFDSEPVALVVVTRKVTTQAGAQTEVTVHTLDAEKCEHRLIFTRILEPNEVWDMTAETSPSLVHAIFTVDAGARQTHLVLPTHGNKLIEAVDIDKALAEGYGGPQWSVDGTAVFAKGLPVFSSSRRVAIKELLAVKQAEDDRAAAKRAAVNQAEVREIAVTSSADAAKDKLLREEALRSYKVAIAIPPSAPLASGSAVLELMPSNAYLRPVKFKGPWVWQGPQFAVMTPQAKRSLLDFGVSKGQANSLWLTLPKTQIDQGVLITPNASTAWLAPENRAVAYLTDGALFVKPIKDK